MHKNIKAIKSGSTEYHPDHLKTKEVFKSLYGKDKKWEIKYDRAKEAQKIQLEAERKEAEKARKEAENK